MICHPRVLMTWVTAGLLLVPIHHARAQDQGGALLTAERVTSELSRDSGLVKALTANLHWDAVLLWPGAPVVVGAAEVRRLLAGRAPDSLQLTWDPLSLELDRDSSLGATWGVAVATARHGQPPQQIGRYIATWRRDDRRWTIAALVFTGVVPLAATALPKGLPLTRRALEPRGAAAPFVSADLAFAQLAGDSGAAVAFERWAAPAAVVFGGRGLLTRGPKAIGQAVAGPAEWRWHPVAAGASRSGDLGWTVGEAVIAAKGDEPSHSKYLTVWIRGDDGAVRFLTDGGNARPAAP